MPSFSPIGFATDISPELDGSSRVAQTGLIEHHGDDKAGLGRGHGTSGHGSASVR